DELDTGLSAGPARAQQLAQGRAGDKIADKDRQAVEIRDIVDGDDSRMSKLGSRERLPLETRDVLCRFEQRAVRTLGGHDPIQPHAERPPDCAETTDANPLEELELAERPGLAVLREG